MLFDQHNQAACVDKNTDDCQNDDDHIVPLNSIRAFHVRSSRLLIHSWRLSNDEVFFRRRRRRRLTSKAEMRLEASASKLGERSLDIPENFAERRGPLRQIESWFLLLQSPILPLSTWKTNLENSLLDYEIQVSQSETRKLVRSNLARTLLEKLS